MAINKVNIEITEEGYTISLKLEGKEYKQVWENTSMGSQMVEGDDFEKLDEIPEDLYYALISFGSYDVMDALQGI